MTRFLQWKYRESIVLRLGEIVLHIVNGSNKIQGIEKMCPANLSLWLKYHVQTIENQGKYLLFGIEGSETLL